MKGISLSIVIPLYNEEQSIPVLYNKLKTALRKLGKNYEIIFVDDGSTDKSYNMLERLHKRDKSVKVIKFRTNFGQTATLDAGLKSARGSIIVTMDADLQNDPDDIPKLVKKMNEGYDVVSGWRYDRKDSFSKRFVSAVSNILRRWITNETLHDSGCSLKAYKRECFDNVELYGEMHRFIPTLLRWKGFKIGEVKVSHLSRKFGVSKYNYKRIPRGFVDLINMRLWMDYSTRPGYLFFKLGNIDMILATIFLLYNLIRYGIHWSGIGPIFLASVLFFVIGLQFWSFGFLAEIQAKTYHRLNKSYNIEKMLK